MKPIQPEVTHMQMDEQLLSSKLNIAVPTEQLMPNLSQASGVTNPEIASLLTEMRTMRSALESQLTTLSWSNMQQRDPVKSQILTTLLSAGFSASLSRQLAEKLPANLDYTKALTWLKTVLLKNLSSAEDDNEILNQGGVYALIGPTGVGKTTTVAKLAARYVMKHGTQSLGLISTDAYRIGGHEQLRIYGKILGVMVYAVKDAADLQIALNELKHKHTVLIDTVGVSQRDQMVNEQISMLSNTSTPIKRLLCLNATSTGETLANVVRAYKGKGLEGCIVTKTDEAATIGNALDAIIRERLKLFYVTNGQRVPEDIVIANKEQLIKEALNHESLQYLPYKFLADELPFVMGSTVNANSYAEAHHA
jgi:flagellar biosynthesis protein FlhF